MTTIDQLEQTIQDFIDECNEHEECGECPCFDLCSRLKFGGYDLVPGKWTIEKVSGEVPC